MAQQSVVPSPSSELDSTAARAIQDETSTPDCLPQTQPEVGTPEHDADSREDETENHLSRRTGSIHERIAVCQ